MDDSVFNGKEDKACLERLVFIYRFINQSMSIQGQCCIIMSYLKASLRIKTMMLMMITATMRIHHQRPRPRKVHGQIFFHWLLTLSGAFFRPSTKHLVVQRQSRSDLYLSDVYADAGGFVARVRHNAVLPFISC